MKIIALEEHFATPEIMAEWQALSPELQDIAVKLSSIGDIERRLFDFADERIRCMDEAGIDVQVLSLTTPGVQSLDAEKAVRLARASNDLVAETVRARPDRFQGFATLPTSSSADAVRELERAVSELGLNGAMLFGRTRERNFDDREFWSIFEAAATLKAPLYLNPQSPLPTVRVAYYSGFDKALNAAFATGGIGWHYETGLQLLRLILSGVFDRFPELQIIVGHWGEMVLFYLDRIDQLNSTAKLKRPVSDYFRSNVFITPSGIFSQRYLRWAIDIVGIERILFSTDYPFIPTPFGGARRFLEEADLTDSEREKIASVNWNRLCAGIRR